MPISRGNFREQSGSSSAFDIVLIMSYVCPRPPNGPKYFAPSFPARFVSVIFGYSSCRSSLIKG